MLRSALSSHPGGRDSLEEDHPCFDDALEVDTLVDSVSLCRCFCCCESDVPLLLDSFAASAG